MSLEKELLRYKTFLITDKGYSPATGRGVFYSLRLFVQYAAAHQIFLPRDVTRELIQEWSEELAWRVGQEKGPIKVVTRASHLVILRGFLSYLYERDLTFTDLSSKVVIPKLPRHLPKEIYEPEEAERMIERASKPNSLGLRNRVILEVLYSSGLRASELGKLRLEHVDYEEGIIYVHEGKGRKDRVVPLGRIACQVIRTYLLAARRDFVLGPDPGTLLLNMKGRRMSNDSIRRVVKDHARLAEVKKKATTHAFRRTCATLMLRGGANIRALQEMLGHERMESTAVYLKVTIKDLKEQHERHHPREARAEAQGEVPGSGGGTP